MNLQAFAPQKPESVQSQMPSRPENRLPINKLRDSSRTTNDFSGALADRSGLLASYIACMHRGALDFFTGGKVLLHSAIDRHHILPRSQFPEKDRPKADNIANIVFISGDINKAIGQSGPEVYLKRIKKQVLQSQCVPTDNTLWTIDKAEKFWGARRELLAESFNEFLRRALPQRKVASS